MSESSRRQAFFGVQALRGIAACMVAIHHSTQIWAADFGRDMLPHVWNTGASGVDIFFGISGFVMAVSTTGQSKPTASKFMGRRVIRIVPLYWLITLTVFFKQFFVSQYPTLGSNGMHAHAPFSGLVASLLFIPYRDPNGEIASLVQAGWTLNFEMFFYLLFAAALALKIKPVHFLTPVMLVLAPVGLFRQESWPAVTIFANPILLEFLAGVLLGYAVERGLRLNTMSAAILGVIGFAAILLNPRGLYMYGSERVLEWGIPAFLVVQATVTLEERFGRSIPSWILGVGDASYSLYLTHMLVVMTVGRILVKARILAPESVFVAIGLVAAVLVSLVLYRFVEKPITTALGRRTSSGAPRIVAVESATV
jgi:exopolysaccharide production protein ExoZ